MLERLGSSDKEFIDSEIKISDERMRPSFGAFWRELAGCRIVRRRIQHRARERGRMRGGGPQAGENPAFQETPASQRRLADLKMAALIKSALREHATTRTVQISVEANGGAITLEGSWIVRASGGGRAHVQGSRRESG